MIKNIKSIICAPPMIVFKSEACPGQSTNVNCRYYYLGGGLVWVRWVGRRVKKALKPRSRVIPRYWDWGFLSRLAVEVT